jgi:predicted Zn finger-like uncharacterized protein
MARVIRCPHCKKSMQVPENAAGKTVRCPSCNQPFAIPSAAAVSPPPLNRPRVGVEARAPVPPPAPTHCPSCGSELLEGAVACMDCGYLLQSDAAEPEGTPNLCVNPACGVANPPGERNCVRCGNPLPMAGGTLLHGRYRLDTL